MLDSLAILTGAAEPLPVVEFSYDKPGEEGPGSPAPLHILWLDGHTWVSAHDVAPLVGLGDNYLGLAMRVGGDAFRAEIDKRLLANGAAMRGTKRGAVLFLSEDGVLGLLYDYERELHGLGYRESARRLRQWLVRVALPTLYGLHLPDLRSADVPVKVHTEATIQEEKERRRAAVANSVAKRSRKRTSLYRFFDADGVLLYVGISVSAAKRISQHEKSKSWWRQVHSITHETFFNRARALAAELEAIRTEKPKYNILGAERG